MDESARDTTVELTDDVATALEAFAPTTAPLIDDAGRVRLSFSRIDMFQNCPRKFRYAYIDRIPGKPAPALSFGTSIHSALEAFYDQKLPTPPSEDALLQFLFDHWDHEGFGELDRDEQVAFYRHAQQILREFHRRESPRYRLPVATEAWFELPFDPDAVVVGFIDRIDRDDDGKFHVIDYKTNRRAQPRQRVAGSLQLAIYALACAHLYGELPATVALSYVVPGVDVRVPIEDIDLDRADQVIRETAAEIRDGRDDPTPNRLCDWCDFRDICPAWDPSVEALGPALERARHLRRQITRDVRELHELETGIARCTDELHVKNPAVPD